MRLDKLLYDPEDFGITKYEWRTDGKLDVFQSIDLSNRRLDLFPFSFGKVDGYFSASGNNLDEYSILDLPEDCKELDLSYNKFKNLNNFFTKTSSISFSANPLESIEGIKEFKFKNIFLRYCSKIKDWQNLPFVEEVLILSNSSIESTDCLKNKKLKYLTITDSKMIYITELEIENSLSIAGTKIKTLKDIANCPKIIYCDKDKEDHFINELKEMFPNSFNLKQINGSLYESK